MTKEKKATCVVYPAADGFRWRLLAGNNRIIAESGEAYKTERNALRAAKNVFSISVIDIYVPN